MKQPVSTLVLVYTHGLDVLLLERADFPAHWQSVTGSREPGEPLPLTAARELAEETGIDADRHGGLADWHMTNVYEIYPKWRHRYAPGTTHNCEHVFALADVLEDRDWLGKHGRVVVLSHADAYRKDHPTDFGTLEEILGEAAEFWQERHVPFWVFVA